MNFYYIFCLYFYLIFMSEFIAIFERFKLLNKDYLNLFSSL